MAAFSPQFPTRTDLQHFRRITWLLGHEAFKDLNIDEKPPTLSTAVDKRLRVFKSLATLLVRTHEVVSVMPCRNGTELPMTPLHREHDRPGDNGGRFAKDNDSADENHTLSVTTQTVEDTNFKFKNRDAIPARFEDHARVVLTMLKKELEKASDKFRITKGLLTYTTRACLLKITTRAAFHYACVAKAIGATKGKADFALLLPPPPSWEKQIKDETDFLGNEKYAIHNSLNAFIQSVGIAKDKDDAW